MVAYSYKKTCLTDKLIGSGTTKEYQTLMSTYTTEAICLKAYVYSESSLILNLYSPDYGLIRAIAKGAKRKKSKLAGACEPLNISKIQCFKGKNLDILSQYESSRTFPNIRGDILKLACATLMGELLNRIATEDDEDSDTIYNLFKHALQALNNTHTKELNTSHETTLSQDQQTQAICLYYQLQLLSEIGYSPIFDRCILTNTPLDASQLYAPFSPELGGLCLTGGRLEESEVEGTTLVNISATTLKVLQAPFSDAWHKANSRKVHRFLQYFWHYKLETQVKAFDFLFDVLPETSTTTRLPVLKSAFNAPSNAVQ